MEKYFKQEDLPIGKGLINVDSNCYFNSLIQCLWTLPAFTEAIKTDDTDAGVLFKSMSNSTHELLKHLTVKGEHGGLFYGMQGDANEGYNFLLDSLNHNSKKHFEIRYRMCILCENCGRKTARDDASIDKPEYMLTVGSEVTNIENHLKYTIHKNSDYKCEGCRKVGTSIIKKSLARLREIIAIVLTNYEEKQSRDIPSEITVTSSTGERKYQLVAFLEHFGNQKGGHYTARGIRRDGTYCFDDSSVNRSTLSTTQNIYMLFYHLTDIEY